MGFIEDTALVGKLKLPGRIIGTIQRYMNACTEDIFRMPREKGDSSSSPCPGRMYRAFTRDYIQAVVDPQSIEYRCIKNMGGLGEVG